MSNVKSIKLHFENLDDFTVFSDNVAEFYLGDFEKHYSRKALNYIGQSEVAKTFYIHIHKEANTNDNRNINYTDELPFDRIKKYADITHVEMFFEDGARKTYSVGWTGDSDYENDSQNAIVDENNGDLYIIVSETLKMEDVFDFDEESVEFYWDMIKA